VIGYALQFLGDLMAGKESTGLVKAASVVAAPERFCIYCDMQTKNLADTIKGINTGKLRDR
jgi:alkylhydroperoxidase family enzyme